MPTLYGHQRSKSHVPPGSASTGGGSGGGLTSGSSKGMPQGGEKVDIAPFGAVRRVGNGSVPEMVSLSSFFFFLVLPLKTLLLGARDGTVYTMNKGVGMANTVGNRF